MSWEPIDHKPPLPPIDLQPVRKPTQPAAQTFAEIQEGHVKEIHRRVEAQRIWEITRQCAEGNGGAG